MNASILGYFLPQGPIAPVKEIEVKVGGGWGPGAGGRGEVCSVGWVGGVGELRPTEFCL